VGAADQALGKAGSMRSLKKFFFIKSKKTYGHSLYAKLAMQQLGFYSECLSFFMSELGY
jgi:hypothetical protein